VEGRRLREFWAQISRIQYGGYVATLRAKPFKQSGYSVVLWADQLNNLNWRKVHCKALLKYFTPKAILLLLYLVNELIY